MRVATESDYDQALVFGENGLVDLPGILEMGEDHRTHDEVCENSSTDQVGEVVSIRFVCWAVLRNCILCMLVGRDG